MAATLEDIRFHLALDLCSQEVHPSTERKSHQFLTSGTLNSSDHFFDMEEMVEFLINFLLTCSFILNNRVVVRTMQAWEYMSAAQH